MVQIELQEYQAQALHGILGNYLSDLRFEIADTENKVWRDNMKKEEGFIKDLMGRLPD